MKCNKCGTPSQGNDVFCRNCGNRFSESVINDIAPAMSDFYDISHVWPQWKIEKVLGKGSYGTVYEAVRCDGIIESRAAVKVISIPVDKGEADNLRLEGYSIDDTRAYFKNMAEAFIEEIRIMESFKGIQNIVSVEDYKLVEKSDEMGWDIFIRMELLTPFNTYACDKNFGEKDVVAMATDLCTALEICNKRKIVHRDIKPENIFVNEFGYYKLGDFGVARSLENKSGALSQKGTFSYMAPEVFFGKTYDERADIYSLGIVLYKLLNNNMLPFLDTRKQLFSYAERKEAIERRFRGEKLPPPCNASPALAKIILKACEFNAMGRYSSAAEMKSAFEAFARGEHHDTTVKVNAPYREKPPVRQNNEVAFGNRNAFTPSAPSINDTPPPVPAKVTSFNQPEKKSGGKKAGIIIAIIAALALVIAGSIVGGALIFRNGDNNGGSSTSSSSTDESTTINTNNNNSNKAPEKMAGAVEYNGHSYLLINDPDITTFDEAKKYCEEKGGHLATITSQGENNFLYNYFTESCKTSFAYFGYDAAALGWVTGEKMGYFNVDESFDFDDGRNYAFHRDFANGKWVNTTFGEETWGHEAVAISASATSILGEENLVHYPARIIDGLPETAWVEGEEGFGIGESVVIAFDKEYLINEIEIMPGYQRSAELFENNARPCELVLVFSDGSRETITCFDKMSTQRISFDSVCTDQVRITIKSAYRGSLFEDTAIAEVDFICTDRSVSFICEWDS